MKNDKQRPYLEPWAPWDTQFGPPWATKMDPKIDLNLIAEQTGPKETPGSTQDAPRGSLEALKDVLEALQIQKFQGLASRLEGSTPPKNTNHSITNRRDTPDSEFSGSGITSLRDCM